MTQIWKITKYSGPRSRARITCDNLAMDMIYWIQNGVDHDDNTNGDNDDKDNDEDDGAFACMASDPDFCQNL